MMRLYSSERHNAYQGEITVKDWIRICSQRPKKRSMG